MWRVVGCARESVFLKPESAYKFPDGLVGPLVLEQASLARFFHVRLINQGHLVTLK